MSQLRGGRPSQKTLADVATLKRARRARSVRRVSMVVLALLVAVALSGVLESMLERSYGDGGTQMTVSQPAILRAGNDVDIEIAVRTSAERFVLRIPLDSVVDIGIEEVWPDPTAQRTVGTDLELEFDPSALDASTHAGESTVRLIGRLDPATGTQTLWFEVGVVGTDLRHRARTWVVP